MQISFEDGASEEIEVTHLTSQSVRLEDTPLTSSAGVRFGDIVEIIQHEGNVFKFVRVIAKSDLEMSSFFLSKEIANSDALKQALWQITSIGVHWEQAFGGMLFLHGSSEQIAAAEALLRKLVAKT
jgi:hypothetical protein